VILFGRADAGLDFLFDIVPPWFNAYARSRCAQTRCFDSQLLVLSDFQRRMAIRRETGWISAQQRARQRRMNIPPIGTLRAAGCCRRERVFPVYGELGTGMLARRNFAGRLQENQVTALSGLVS